MIIIKGVCDGCDATLSTQVIYHVSCIVLNYASSIGYIISNVFYTQQKSFILQNKIKMMCVAKIKITCAKTTIYAYTHEL